MALDRWKLRDDLVAMIAAGRELSPEHDYALADVFLEHAHESLLVELTPPGPPVKQSHVAAFIGAGFLALAALMSPLFLAHEYHHANGFSHTLVMPPDRDDQVQFGPAWWWNGGQQGPNAP